MIVMSPSGDDHSHDEIVARLDRIITLLEEVLDQRRASPNGSGTPMGADELGALLKHTPDWVRAACRAGRLPHQKIGKLYVFTPEDVAEIFGATAVGVRTEPATVRSGRRRARTFYRPAN